MYLDKIHLVLSVKTQEFQDQRLIGDLHYRQGSNIHSLTWIVELSTHCDINQILHEHFSCSHHISSVFNQSSFSLILLKKIEPFNNTYLIAHPYYKLYKKIKRKYITNYKKYILLHDSYMKREQITKRNSTCFKPRLSYLIDTEVFISLKNCVNKFLQKNLCIEYFQQEILRPRNKRMKIEFEDPLYKDQWHLVSSIFMSIILCVNFFFTNNKINLEY